jgi:hypothetical protein
VAKIRTVAFWTAGILASLCAALAVAGLWLAGSLYRSEPADAARAAAAMGEIRARYPGVPPAFEIQHDRLTVVRPPSTATVPQPSAAHLLIHEPQQRMLHRMEVPLWIGKFATEPIPIEALARVSADGIGSLREAQRRGNELSIRIRDLEQYGRALLLDGSTSDGRRIMIWTE